MVSHFPGKVVHGGSGKLQQEKTHKKVLDFSASVNPYPPRVDWHCDPADLAVYPDDNYTQLKESIAHEYHRDPCEICVGNGSIELIRVFCSVTMHANRKYFCDQPTFGEYDLSARLAGASGSADPASADVVFLCNPNNPTGILQQKAEVLDRLETIPHEAMLFCDEAFIDLSDPRQSLSGTRDPRLFVLQSLTKSFAVPGIRFGFGFGDPELVRRIETVRPPWSVNAYAETFAIAALRHRGELEKSRILIGKARDRLRERISALGLHPYDSSANYILIDCGMDVSPLCERIMQRGVLVRDGTSFGLPTFIRVAVRTNEENEILIEALRLCLS